LLKKIFSRKKLTIKHFDIKNNYPIVRNITYIDALHLDSKIPFILKCYSNYNPGDVKKYFMDEMISQYLDEDIVSNYYCFNDSSYINNISGNIIENKMDTKNKKKNNLPSIGNGLSRGVNGDFLELMKGTPNY